MTTYIHHIMPTLREAFLSQITRTDGRISPRSLKYSYFSKHNITHLWDHFDHIGFDPGFKKGSTSNGEQEK